MLQKMTKIQVIGPKHDLHSTVDFLVQPRDSSFRRRVDDYRPGRYDAATRA